MWWLLAALPPGVEALDAAREAAPRPAECRQINARGQTGGGLWSAVRDARLVDYCRWLARGYSALRRDPKLALEAADRAHRLAPKRAAPEWLAGQALFVLGRAHEAHARFNSGFALEPSGPAAPAQLQDAARVAFLYGNQQLALELYRRLVPQASLLSNQRRRHALFVEAAIVSMRAGELDIAAGYLSEARLRRGNPGFSSFALGALALVRDRQGRQADVRAIVREAGGPSVLLRQLEYLKHGNQARLNGLPNLPEPELHAMAAMLTGDPAESKQHWAAYLKTAPKDDRWRSHAEQKLRAGG